MPQLSTLAALAGLIMPLSAAAPARADGFSAPEMWIDNYGVAQGWRAGKHLRMLADIDGDGRADVVGFGETGVFVSRSVGDRFTEPEVWVENYSYNQGWRLEKHVRALADVDDDGMVDIVGFGTAGLFVSVSTGDAFRPPDLWIDEFSYNRGWRVERHPRYLADVDNDDRMDIVAFGDGGVLVSKSNGHKFDPPALWVEDFGYHQGWRTDRHIRVLADVDADDRADVIGFGDDGVLVSRASGNRFTSPKLYVEDFGAGQGWRLDRHVRVVADVSGNGKADIIGFGQDGTLLSLARASTFGDPHRAFKNLGYDQGWRVDRHPRLAGDVDGDERADIIGFGDDGVYLATSRSTDFVKPYRAIDDFGYDQGWRVGTHVRALADVNGDGLLDVVGFGDHGTLVALAEP